MIVAITKLIKLVRPEAPARFPYSNSLFIDDEKKIVIDAGAGGRAYSDISLSSIDKLLFTHFHFDHVNCAPLFAGRPKLSGREEIMFYQDENQFYRALGYHHWQEVLGTPYDGEHRPLPQIAADIPLRPGFNRIELAGSFQDGDCFDTGKTKFYAVHTPGHSPGHYAFFFPQEEILYAGDLDATRNGPWYADEYASIEAIIESIGKMIALEPRLLLSSHRNMIDKDIEKTLVSYLNVIFKREDLIFEFLTQPRTLDDIYEQRFIYEWGFEGSNLPFWYRAMILKHLERLIKNDRVIRTEDKKFIKKL